MKLFNVFPFIL